MKYRIWFCLAAALLLLCSTASAEVNGTYRGRYKSADGRTHLLTFVLKAEGANLTGTAAGTVNKTAIADGKVNGEEVSFSAQWPYGKFFYKGKVVGDELKLTIQAGEYTTEMTAQRLTE
jgi:hypothetical protein